MRLIESCCKLTANLLAFVGGAAMVLMLGHMVVEIFCRYVLGIPLLGTLEVVSGYYMVAIAFLPLGFVVDRGGHIMVDLFTRSLSSRTQSKIDSVVGFVGTAFFAVVAWRTFVEAIRNTAIEEGWETADGMILIWPSRWVVPIGCSVMAAMFAIHAIHNLAAVRRARAEPPDA